MDLFAGSPTSGEVEFSQSIIADVLGLGDSGDEGLAIALHPDAVAVVLASKPRTVLLASHSGSGGSGAAFARRSLAAPSGPLRALRFSKRASDRTLLLAVSPYEAYLWDIEGNAPLVSLLGVMLPLTSPPALCFDESAALVALGGEGDGVPRLLVFQAHSGVVFAHARIPCVGTGHATIITSCSFLRDDFGYIFVVATHAETEQKGIMLTFDLRGSVTSVVDPTHESEELEGAPFFTLAPSSFGSFLAGGVGVVWVLHVHISGLVCTAQVKIGVPNMPVWLSGEGSELVEEDPPILALEATCCRVAGAPLQLCGIVALAVTARSVYVVWCHRKRAERLSCVPGLRSASACVTKDSLLAACLPAFGKEVKVARISLCPSLRWDPTTPSQRSDQALAMGTAREDPPICSISPLGPVPEDSILGRALSIKPRTPTLTHGARRRGCSAPSRGQVVTNQPVTFHQKVRSAGYGPPTQQPRMLGRPRVSSTTRRLPERPNFDMPPSGQRPGTPGSVQRGSLGFYSAVGPPLEHVPDQTLNAYKACAVVDLCYTPQATHLVVAGNDRTISAYRLPLRSRSSGFPRPLAFGGRQGELLSLCPSYTDSHSTGAGGGPLLLTSSADHTVSLWALGGSRAGAELICFDRVRTNIKPQNRDNNQALDQVHDAQFLCLDGAIALASGPRLGIYRYQLHVQDSSDDIKRLQRFGAYKCCGLLSLPSEPSVGQHITAVATNNAMITGTVLVASSSKRVYVWDVTSEKVLAGFGDGHARSISCLRLATPHAEFQSVQSLDLFYTAALDGTVKLWDLRLTSECLCFVGGHVHSSQRLRCRLSPCLRYMCTPSEDGAVVVYDVRTSRLLGSRHCHRDAVCSVDVHPRSGWMASGGFDGKVNFFRAPQLSTPKVSGRPPGGLLERRPAPKSVREVEMSQPF